MQNLPVTRELDEADWLDPLTIEISESTLPCKCLVCKTAPATQGLLKMETEMLC